MENKKGKEEQLIEEIKALKNRIAELEKSEFMQKKAQGMSLEAQKHKIILNTAMDGFCVTDTQGRFLEVNDAYCGFIGYSREELLRMSICDVEAVESIGDISQHLKRVIETTKDRFETRHKCKDGRVIDIEVCVNYMKEDHGRFFIFLRDITKLNRAEEELKEHRDNLEGLIIYRTAELEREIIVRKSIEKEFRRQQEYLQLQIDRMPIGCIVWDCEFRVMSWNPAAERIFGFAAQEAMGKHPYDFIVPKEAQLHVDKIWSRLLEGDLTANSTNENFTKDGRMIICEWTNTPLRRSDGVVIGVLSMAQDITERKKVQEALQESENKFRSLAEKSLVGIYLIQDGIFKYANPRFLEIFGYSVEEIIDKMGPKDLIHVKDWPIAEENIRQRIIGETKSVHYGFRGLKKGKNIIYIEVYGTLVEYHNKPAIIGTLLDITERKKADEREKELIAVKAKAEVEKARGRELRKAYDNLKELQERLIRSEKLAALGKLAGIVGHELRNPLGVIRNSVYFLRMKLGEAIEDEKIKRHLEILDKEVNESDRIITDILTFTKIKEPRLVKTEINEVIKISLRKVKIPQTIKVVTKLKNDLPGILADAVQLERVFHNIILNAVEAMPDKGRLIVTSIKKGDFLEVHISDTGKGIPREDLGKIFGVLFSNKVHGIGLGLSLCQEIIQGHKGKIEVESEEGKGTEFIIKLPVTKKKVMRCK